jgi:hypothetical protein
VTRLLVCLTLLAACLLIVLGTALLAAVEGQNWWWVGVSV